MGDAPSKQIVTTGSESRQHQVQAARELAARHGLPFVLRRGRSVPKLHAEERADVVAVLTERGLVLHRGQQRLAYGAGIAELRIKRLRSGERDPLIELLRLRPGERVLDATLGFGRDALVMAEAGAEVDGVEAVPLLAAFTEAGLATVEGASAEAAKRVRVLRGDSGQRLAEAAEASYDAVYFDPMFSEQVKAPPAFELFRALADPRPLDRVALECARRVARRVVVIKDAPRGALLKSLGLPFRELTFGNRVRYGALEALPTR